MPIEPKFLLIPKDDYKILCDQSKGNPLIASIVMQMTLHNCYMQLLREMEEKL